MPPCPNCHKEVTKRKNDACPHCEQAISLYKGRFFRTETGAPNMAIITRFEERVTEFLSKKASQKVAFRINRKIASKWAMELRTAEQILEVCDYDFDLALRTIDVLFTHASWAWKSRSSLTQLMSDFDSAFAIASVAQQVEMAKYVKEQALKLTLDQKEDVFG